MSHLIKVKVIPKASFNRIKEEGEILKVYITAAPQKGSANKALLKLLATHLHCKKSSLKIIKGEKSREKIVQVEE